MRKTISIIISIILLLVIFFIGGGVGVLYQTQKAEPQSATNINLEKANNLIKVLSANNASISVNGKITKIDGDNITLQNGADSSVTTVDQNSQVYSFLSGKGAVASLKDVKIGYNAVIAASVSPDGTIVWNRISIFPAPGKAVQIKK